MPPERNFRNKKAPYILSILVGFGWWESEDIQGEKLQSLFQTGLMKTKFPYPDEFPLQPFETSFQKMLISRQNPFFLFLLSMNRISFSRTPGHGRSPPCSVSCPLPILNHFVEALNNSIETSSGRAFPFPFLALSTDGIDPFTPYGCSLRKFLQFSPLLCLDLL